MQTEPQRGQLRDLRDDRRQITSAMLGVASVFLLSLIFQLLIGTVVLLVSPETVRADWYGLVISMVPMYLLAMPLSLFLFGMGDAEPPERKKLSAPVFLGLLAICFALTYAGNFLGTLVNFVLSCFTGRETINPVASMTTDSPFWANLLFIGILAPVLEELFYRKLVIDRLRRFGDLPAILLSGIGFGLIHGNFNQFFYAAILGCVFGYIYLRTGKIRYTIALHMSINLIGGVYATEMLRHLDLELLAADPTSAYGENLVGMAMALFYLGFLAVMMVGAVIAVILLVLRWRAPLHRAARPLTAREWCRILLANPACWLFAAVVLLLFLV